MVENKIDELKINEDYLEVLMLSSNGRSVINATIKLTNPFFDSLDALKSFVEDTKSLPDDMLSYLYTNHKFDLLDGKYHHCEDLASRSVIITFDNNEAIDEISKSCEKQFSREVECLKQIDDNALKLGISEDVVIYEKLKYNQKFQIELTNLKKRIYRKYKLFSKMYSLKKAYRKCYEDSRILTFSHTNRGWSNPAFHLNENFSVEINTNFGYGLSSYFYLNVKYKGVYIYLFSDYVKGINVYEITDYTRSYAKWDIDNEVCPLVIENSSWHDALLFLKIICNSYLENETNFIETYILEECRALTSGLKSIIKENVSRFDQDEFGFKLIEFKAERVSGALNLIDKIKEYKILIEVDSLIKEIEGSNRLFQTILFEKIKDMTDKIYVFEKKLEDLKPIFAKANDQYHYCLKRRESLTKSLVIALGVREEHLNKVTFDKLIDLNFPTCKQSIKDYENMERSIDSLQKNIMELKVIIDNTKRYYIKIVDYFKLKSC